MRTLLPSPPPPPSPVISPAAPSRSRAALYAILALLLNFGSARLDVRSHTTLITPQPHNPQAQMFSSSISSSHCEDSVGPSPMQSACCASSMPLSIHGTHGFRLALRLRGAGGRDVSNTSGKRRFEHVSNDLEESEEGGIPRQWWGAKPKRARAGGLISSMLSASYAAATLPLNVAYGICTAIMAAPLAAVKWMMIPPAKRHISDEELLRFSGDDDKPGAIQRQIEFYFSDSNLPLDS